MTIEYSIKIRWASARGIFLFPNNSTINSKIPHQTDHYPYKKGGVCHRPGIPKPRNRLLYQPTSKNNGNIRKDTIYGKTFNYNCRFSYFPVTKGPEIIKSKCHCHGHKPRGSAGVLR